MSFFDLFSRQKKETLDNGLQKTKESLFGKINRAIAGKSKVDDEVLDDLEEVLITSDVGVDTTLEIIRRIEERVARDKYVNTKELNEILHDEIQNRGTIDHAPVYPREVIRRALELSSRNIIVVHNHPSGDPTPSRADIDMTKQIVAAGHPLNVTVHDHLIVGREGVASFKQLGLM